jgi:1-phosphofructokinase/tagatose 6-phosphate kinase
VQRAPHAGDLVGRPLDAPARLAEAARRAGARVALDARDDGLSAGLRARPDFVKVNASEADGLGIAGAAALLEAAGGRTGCAAAITHGADGMELALPDGRTVRAAPPALGAYPVGSGDAFLGGLLAALDAGADFADAFGLALGAAAANAELPGAGRLDPSRAADLSTRASVRLV